MTDMMSNLYGNPHSASASSQLSTNRIEDTRLQVLQFFRADPDDFDVVFVANATAGIKLVMDAFRELEGGFSYGYHKDAHTSLVGVRENATHSRCLDDEDVERWLSGKERLVAASIPCSHNIFAFPAQSNLNGRRLPLSWITRSRQLQDSLPTYTLLDAAALVSTSQLDLSNAEKAPDFTVLSFYKIFGFPDLGAVIVRKESGSILQKRKYFGGGTVDTVLSVREQWHVLKENSLHETLEDGTVPFHSIMALDAAITVHGELYGSMHRIAKHTSFLAQQLYDGLASLRHANSEPVCVIYSHGFASRDTLQGPVIAFNVRNSSGAWVSNTEFERLASVKKFHIRSGGLCNPGGVATCLDLQPWEIRRNFSAGLRCGTESDMSIYAGKPTGILRASIGAMSTKGDIDAFLSFVREFYTEVDAPSLNLTPLAPLQKPAYLLVESLTVYPIKSCGGFKISPDVPWEVRPEGLAWDREWCLVHRGTGQALSQKRHPRMALIQPSLDFHRGTLCISYRGELPAALPKDISVPLSSNPALYSPMTSNRFVSSRVCGDRVLAQTYANDEINEFFTAILGVTCALARFPAGGSGFSMRHSKAHMQKHQRQRKSMMNDKLIPGSYPSPPTPPDSDSEIQKRPILLSNESPILTICRSSLNALNEIIANTGGKPVTASVFRANVVLASSKPEHDEPYGEDQWTSIRIGRQSFQMLGSCRRCHMICTNQESGEKDEEPFITLAKTRRFDSKIFFGSHMCHINSKAETKEGQFPTIKVGAEVETECVT